MKKRIFARGIRKFVNVEMIDDHSQPVPTAYVTLIEDGADPCMLMKWTVQGAIMCGGVFHAIRANDLAGLMDVLDHFKGELPVMLAQIEQEQVA